MSKNQRERQRAQRKINRYEERSEAKPGKISNDWKAVASVYVTLKTIKTFCEKEKRANEQDNQLLKPRQGRYFEMDLRADMTEKLPAKW